MKLKKIVEMGNNLNGQEFDREDLINYIKELKKFGFERVQGTFKAHMKDNKSGRTYCPSKTKEFELKGTVDYERKDIGYSKKTAAYGFQYSNGDTLYIIVGSETERNRHSESVLKNRVEFRKHYKN